MQYNVSNNNKRNYRTNLTILTH